MRKLFFFIPFICSFCYPLKPLEGQIPSNVPKSGLVAWYPFNGNANDESGSALNGKVLGAVLTEDRFNKKNAAYEFSKDKLIEIPNTEDKNLYPLSVSLWYYVDSLWDGDNCALFSKYERASWNGYSIVYGDFRNVDNGSKAENNGFGTESVFLRDFNNRIIGYYTEPPFIQEKISSKKWYHYVFTVNENGGKIYADGKLISTDQWTGQPGKTSSNWLWKIGRVYAETNRLKVKIDDVGVWNRALTSEEVKNLYDGESATGQPCSSSPTVKDIDGNTYNTVQIGGQCWTKENLKTTKYNDGSTIPLDNSGGTAGNGSGQTWSTRTTGARTVYGHDNNNLSSYGYLYNGYAASASRNICPSGWHVPTDGELTTLTTYLGGSTVAGGKLKASGSNIWENGVEASNSSGFTGLPSGFRSAGSDFRDIRFNTYFWSSSNTSQVNAWQFFVTHNDNLTRRDSSSNENGFSIRCVKDVINNTPCPGTPTVKDIDGNTYNTVQIGEQCWTKENLKTTKYNDGSTIPLDNSGGTAGNGSGQTWSTLKTGARTVYGHDNNNLSTYGYLYNGYAASDSRNICPSGWHVPTDGEWTTLSDFLGGSAVAGGKLKSEGALWLNSIDASNTSGFTALPSGLRNSSLGDFVLIGSEAFFWSKTDFNGWAAYNRVLKNSTSQIFRQPSDHVYSAWYQTGVSIRCLRDSIIASLKITTTNIGSTTATSAISGGTISSTDNTSVTARGVCWNTSGTPTIQDSKTLDGSGYGSFESSLTNLQPNTLYHLRAYANTPNGAYYGNEITFKTKSLDSNAVVLIIPKVKVACDSFLEIPLLVYNFKNVSGAQGSMNWDASKLKFEGVVSFGPASLGLTVNDFGLNDIQNGKLSFIWNDNNLNGITLTDSTSFFVMKYKLLDVANIFVTEVNMSNSPIDIELFNSNFEKLKVEIGTLTFNQACFKVSGNIKNPKGLNIPSVTLVLSDNNASNVSVTDRNGNYYYSNLPQSNYTLTPNKLIESNVRNGVSTIDVGLIQAHILGKRILNNPYQLMAADVNGSNSITNYDIILIRRFILGSETNFGGKLYSFVDKKHVFTNPLNPFPFPQSININNTQNQVVGDFIGVKLGDVNFDNTPQNFVPKASRDRKIEFVYEIITPTVSKRSNEVIYRIKSAKQQELLGMQFTLNWDSKLAELVAIEHNPLGIFLANETGDNGSLGLSWNAGSGTPKMLQENEVVFEIRVKLNARYMSVPLNINDDLLEREAFDADFKVKELSLKLENVSNTVISSEVKLNVFPNPTQGNFTLNFNSNMAEKGYIMLTDMLGRTLVNQEIQISKGMNNLMIDLSSNVVTGTYNLQLRTSNNFETVKILIDNNK